MMEIKPSKKPALVGFIEAIVIGIGLMAIAILLYSLFLISASLGQWRLVADLERDISQQIYMTRILLSDASQPDKSKLDADILTHLETARRHCALINKGGKVGTEYLKPISDEEVKENLNILCLSLDRIKRFVLPLIDTPEVNPQNLQKYIKEFNVFLQLTSDFKSLLIKNITRMKESITQSLAVILLLLVALFTIVPIVIMRNRNAVAGISQDMDEGLVKILSSIDTGVDGIITIDEHGIIDSINGVAENMLAYTAAELVGENVTKIMPAEFHNEQHTDYIKHYLQTGEAKAIGNKREVMALRKDGKSLAIEISVAPLLLGKRMLFTAIFRDISTKRRSEEVLIKNQKILSSLVNSLPGVFFRCVDDEKLSLEFISKGCQELLGYAPTDLINNKMMSFSKIFDDADLKSIRELLKTVIIDKKPAWTTCSVQAETGVSKRVLLHISTTVMKRNGQLVFQGYFIEKDDLQKPDETLDYKKALELFPDALFILNERGEVEYANGPFISLCKTKYDEILGNSVQGIFSGKTGEWWKNDQKHPHDGVLFKDEKVTLRSQVGTKNCQRLSAYAFYAGSRQMILCFMMDRKEDSFELSEIQHLIISQLPVAAMMTDEQGNIEYINPEFEHVFGYSRDEVLGRTAQLLSVTEGDDSFFKEIKQSMLSRKAFTGEFIHATKEKVKIKHCVSIAPMLDKQGNINHFIVIFHPIVFSLNEKTPENLHYYAAVRHLQDLISVPIIVFDYKNNQMKYINEQAEQMLGCKQNIEQDNYLDNYLDIDSQKHLDEQVNEILLDSNKLRVLSLIFITKQGKVSTDVRMIRNDKNDADFIVLVVDKSISTRAIPRPETAMTGNYRKFALWQQQNNRVQLDSLMVQRFPRHLEKDMSLPAFINSIAEQNQPQLTNAIEFVLEGKNTHEIVCQWEKFGLGKVNAKLKLVYVKIDQQDCIEFHLEDLPYWLDFEKVSYLAYYDDLTHLPNRTLFMDRFKQVLLEAERSQKTIALMFIDVDQFKQINDQLGHDGGDLLLRNVANYLKENVRMSATVARYGGDEFVVLLPDVSSPKDVANVAQRLLNIDSVIMDINHEEVSVTLSIGLALFPDDGLLMEDIIKKSDKAMYDAKSTGPGQFKFYSTEVNSLVLQRINLERDLKASIEKQEFVLHFQPQLDFFGKVIAVEAFIRWQNSELGLLKPKKFLAIAEETGLILPLGEWIIQKACEQKRKWMNEGLSPFRLALNLSSVQLMQDKLFVRKFDSILRTAGIDPYLVDVEIKEQAIMTDGETMVTALLQMKEIGIQLVLDDFGTGFSKISSIKKIKFDKIKIDESIIKGLENNADDMSVTTTIITIAHSLNIKVIAEGVETAHQYSFLKSNQCDYFQGDFHCEALPAAELIAAFRLKKNVLFK